MHAVVVSRFPLCRDALARLIGSTFGSDRAEGFATLQGAVAAKAQDTISMLVLDVEPNDPQLGELKAAVQAIAPAPLVLFAIMTPSEAEVAHEAGVKGCIPKTAAPELMAAAMRLILVGGIYFSDLATVSPGQRGDPPLRSRLSTRQLEVLRLIEMGQTNKEIAKALGISVATVKLHVQAILNITGARNRTEAALRARGQFK